MNNFYNIIIAMCVLFLMAVIEFYVIKNYWQTGYYLRAILIQAGVFYIVYIYIKDLKKK
jgi:hypothetical protein